MAAGKHPRRVLSFRFLRFLFVFLFSLNNKQTTLSLSQVSARVFVSLGGVKYTFQGGMHLDLGGGYRVAIHLQGKDTT